MYQSAVELLIRFVALPVGITLHLYHIIEA